MEAFARAQLTRRLSSRVTFDRQIASAYDHDIGEMPAALTAVLANVPEAVVAARDVADVVAVMTVARRYRIAVVPRGQGTSGYGGAIPTRGGILLDLSNMSRILGVDRRRMTADVEPGVVWEDLCRVLAKEGLDNRIYPTSAPSSTVGGWFAQGGVGIGSMKYGDMRDNVEEIDVVGLDGVVRTYSGRQIDPYYQTCGILGTVTRIRLMCRRRHTVEALTVAFGDPSAAGRFVRQARRRLAPYTIVMHSPGYLEMRRACGDGAQVPEGAFAATVVLAENPDNAGHVTALARSLGGVALGSAVGRHIWEDRFYPMRIKKIGPSVVVGEFYLPEENFGAAWRLIEKDLPGDILGMEALAVHGGQIAVLLYILDDAADLWYPVRMGKAIRAMRIAERCGGAKYTPGMWFATSSQSILGDAKYTSVLRLKRRLDPDGLLNPGKILSPSVRGLPMVRMGPFLDLGTRVAAGICKLPLFKKPERRSAE